MERRTVSTVIDAATLVRALSLGRSLLQEHVDEINRMNVFPVPDGDTGTNMLLTVDAVVQGLEGAGASLPQVMERVSRSALLGARGNSGVILAQFLVGFAAGVGDKEVIDVNALREGFIRGTQEAYRIVSHPQEGTILTIMRAARDAIIEHQDGPLPEVIVGAHNDARETLARTPEMLPLLKRAGVIDAGGLGFVYLLSALVAILDEEPRPSASLDELLAPRPDDMLERIQQEEPPAHRYCTEFIVQGRDIPQTELRRKLDHRADSVLVLGDTDHTHVHLHTDDPGQAMRTAATYGRVFQVKVDDMYEQMKVFLQDDAPVKDARETALVAVSPGEGITEILMSIGANQVLTGDQTVGDLIEAVMRIGTGTRGVILLPNDPNILLACKQAGELIEQPTLIVPSESVPQGISALLSYDPQQGLEENAEAMQAAMAHVRSGSVGRALRPSMMDGVDIALGDYVGMFERQIVSSGRRIDEVILEMLEPMDADTSEVITLFYGIGEEERGASVIADGIRSRYPNADVQVYYGGQDRYEYLISVE